MAQATPASRSSATSIDDPELRFTPSGAAVAKFTVASTPRLLDKQTNEWKDGDSLFLRCTVWRQAAENVAESLTRGIAGHRHGPAQAAVVRDQGGREAHGRRAARSTRSARRCGTPRPRSPRLAAAAAAAAASAAARVRRPCGRSPDEPGASRSPAAGSGGSARPTTSPPSNRHPTTSPD